MTERKQGQYGPIDRPNMRQEQFCKEAVILNVEPLRTHQFDDLHRYHIEQHPEMERTSPIWCWPTRETMRKNLALNKDLLGPTWSEEFADTYRRLRRKEWTVELFCEPHCHAPHMVLTAAGIEALRLMNAGGCEGHMRDVHRRERCYAKFRFLEAA